jgi:hypothetical protein
VLRGITCRLSSLVGGAVHDLEQYCDGGDSVGAKTLMACGPQSGYTFNTKSLREKCNRFGLFDRKFAVTAGGEKLAGALSVYGPRVFFAQLPETQGHCSACLIGCGVAPVL